MKIHKFIEGNYYRHENHIRKGMSNRYLCTSSGADGVGFISPNGSDIYYSFRDYPRLHSIWLPEREVRKVNHWK